MATATPKAKQPSKKIKLMGPAQEVFGTFMKQCTQLTDIFWPDWKNYETPSSYMIPLVFDYLHPDVSDEAIRIVQTETFRRAEGAAYSTMDRLLTDRTSDIAEHIVNTALQALVEEKVRAPFVVIHNLDMHNNQKLISHLFPILNNEHSLKESFEKCKREYDFLIIGPHIGIIAIEVKSSQFTMGKDFDANSKCLPRKYFDGLQQLRSVDALVHILTVCAEIQSAQEITVRKIIFTPNLNGGRYEKWKNSIGDEACRKIESQTTDMIQWFAEDMDNFAVHSNKPPLYSALRNLLETRVDQIKEISDITEKYALLVSGFRSMILIGGNIEPDMLYFSQNEAISTEHRRIVEQNPFEGQHNTKVSEHSILNLIDQSKFNYEPKLFFLSPDQQAVLEGPPRQFIIGAAGTGKTVILQAKAMQLLSRGGKVVVFSKEYYKEQYEKLFESCGFENYECLVWPRDCFTNSEQLRKYLDSYIRKAARNKTFRTKEVMRHIFEHVKEEAISKSLNWLNGKNVLIDDTCDERWPVWKSSINPATNLFVAWAFMVYVDAVCPSKVTWTAFDQTVLDFSLIEITDLTANILCATLEELFNNGLEQTYGEQFRVSVLKQVMRCSEMVYNAAYSSAHRLPYIAGTDPILAHKIQGLNAVLIPNEHFDSATGRDAMNRMCVKVQESLVGLSRDGVDMENVVVIFGEILDEMQRKSSIKIANTSIPVYGYDEVSSMEWPVVIYAACFPASFLHDVRSSQYLFLVGYPRYRATTRATTKLIEITVTFGSADCPSLYDMGALSDSPDSSSDEASGEIKKF